MNILFNDFQLKMSQQGFTLALEKKSTNFKFDDGLIEAYYLYYHPTKHILIVADTYSYTEAPLVNSAQAYMAYAFNNVYSKRNSVFNRLLSPTASFSWTRSQMGECTALICTGLENGDFDFNQAQWQEEGYFRDWSGLEFSHSVFLRGEFFTDKDTHNALEIITKMEKYSENQPTLLEIKQEAKRDLVNKNFIRKHLDKAIKDWSVFYNDLPENVQNKFNLVASNNYEHSHHDINNAFRKTNRLYPYIAQEINSNNHHFKPSKSKASDRRIGGTQAHLDDFCARSIEAEGEQFSMLDKALWEQINYNLKMTKEAASLNLNPKKLAQFLDAKLKGEVFKGLGHEKFKFINFFVAMSFMSSHKNISHYYFKKAVEENNKTGFFDKLINYELFESHTTKEEFERKKTSPGIMMTVLEELCFGVKASLFSKYNFSQYLCHYFKPQINNYFLNGGSFNIEKIGGAYDIAQFVRTNLYLKAILNFEKAQINWWGTEIDMDKIGAYKKIIEQCEKYKQKLEKEPYLKEIQHSVITAEKACLLKVIKTISIDEAAENKIVKKI